MHVLHTARRTMKWRTALTMNWNDGSRWHLAGASLLGAQSFLVYAIVRSNAVVAGAAAHTLLLASRCGTQLGSQEDCRNVTCAEDVAMNEGEQCLRRDVTGSRCLEEGFGKNMLDVCLRTSVARSDTTCTHKSSCYHGDASL